MGELVVYLLTLASVGTVAILELYRDLKRELHEHRKKGKRD